MSEHWPFLLGMLAGSCLVFALWAAEKWVGLMAERGRRLKRRD